MIERFESELLINDILSDSNISLWQIETEEDIKKYLDELKTKLMATLEDDTIINIEF